MSDLTRLLLDAHDATKHLNDRYDPRRVATQNLMAHAAPTLARQVEAVEALADQLDAEGSALMEDADRTRAYPAHAHAARIRDALNVTD